MHCLLVLPLETDNSLVRRIKIAVGRRIQSQKYALLKVDVSGRKAQYGGHNALL